MGGQYKLNTCLSRSDVEMLRVGDTVYFSGEIYTMRDQAHLRALDLISGGGKLPFDLHGKVIYHCGPLVKDGSVISAGPTTSMRMERVEGQLIRATGLRAVIGKGGMGPRTLRALKEQIAVYLEYPGGVGALAAKAMPRIIGVFWEDLGDPEAVWRIQTAGFGPCFVTMDSQGGSLRTEPHGDKRIH